MSKPKAVLIVDERTEKFLMAITIQEVEILAAAQRLIKSFDRYIELREPAMPNSYHKGPRNRWGKLK